VTMTTRQELARRIDGFRDRTTPGALADARAILARLPDTIVERIDLSVQADRTIRFLDDSEDSDWIYLVAEVEGDGSVSWDAWWGGRGDMAMGVMPIGSLDFDRDVSKVAHAIQVRQRRLAACDE
jgi:hypothetical protein